MSEELKPCPFCGQQDAFVEQLDSDASVVICQGMVDEHCACLARGPVGVQQSELEDQPGRDAAIEAWNSRAQPAEAEGVELDTIVCWNCGQKVTLEARDDEDGFCPHCMCELDLSDYLINANAALSAVTAERDRLREENKRLDLMVAQADHNYDMDRNRMIYLLRTAHDCLEQWNLKYPRLARRGEEFSSEHTYRQIRAFVPEYREADAAMAAKEA